jgi:hypothetical protein
LFVVSIPLGALALAASLLTILPFSVVSAFFAILWAVLFLFLAVTILAALILLLLAQQLVDIIAPISPAMEGQCGAFLGLRPPVIILSELIGESVT